MSLKTLDSDLRTDHPPLPAKGPTPPRKRWLRFWLWVATIAFTAFLLIGLVIPYVLSSRIEKITGRAFNFGFLAIAPNGRVSISLQGAQDLNRQIYLDAGNVRFDWWSLLFKRMRVGYVELRDARFEIEKTKTGDLIVNSVNFSKLSREREAEAAKKPEPQAEEGSWGLGLGRVEISGVEVNYREADLRVQLRINHFLVGPVETWAAERRTPFEADLTLNGGKIALKGFVTPLSPSLRFDSKVAVTALPLNGLEPLAKGAAVHDLNGALTVDGQAKGAFEKESQALQLSWDGDVIFRNVSVLYKKFRLLVDGPLRLEKIEVEKSGYSAETIKNAGPFFLQFRDESFPRPPQIRLEPLNFEVRGLDSRKPDQKISLNLNAGLGKYGRWDLSGHLAPFGKTLNGKMTTKLKELDLAPLTAYAEKATGSRIQTGVLNLDVNADVRDGQLSAKNSLFLKKLEFQYINQQKEDEQTGKVGIPINIFLSLLRDKNGDIALDVPIEGPISDPNLGLGSLMAKLAGKALAYAAEQAATAFFPPFKTIELANSALTFATKWRFEPILFQAKTLQLTRESEAYLEEVGKKLRERPQVRLTICGFGVRSDLGSGQSIPTASEKDRLLKLADGRAAAIKDFLVARFGIESERLILCSPNLEEAPSALPRGTLSI